MIYPTGQAKRLVVDEVDLELAGPGIGALTGDLGLEEILELESARRLARRGVPRDDQELRGYQRAMSCMYGRMQDSRAYLRGVSSLSEEYDKSLCLIILGCRPRDDAAIGKTPGR